MQRGREHGKKLEDVTTSSIDAFKAYAEGSRLHDRLQEREAQSYFERAVAADPNFAMALAKLSVVHANLDNIDQARQYAARACEKSTNLPPGERYYIEGRRYSLDPATMTQAVDAYQKAVDASPDHVAARNNLAQLLLEQRRYPEALAHLEELRRRGMSFPGTYMSLAEAYVATSQPEKAREALTAYVSEHPDRSAAYENLGAFEISQGRLDAALAALDRAAELHPDQLMRVEEGRFVVRALQDRWPEAQAAGERLLRREDPRDRWVGGEVAAITSLYRGDVAAARQLADEGAQRGRSGEQRAGARLFRAQLEKQLGQYREALQQAERALEEAKGVDKLQAEGQAVRAVCLAHLGRRADAERTAAEVERRLAMLPNGQGEPALLQLRAALALARGDNTEARRRLEQAAALPSATKISVDPRRVELQYDLARAALGGGDADAARRALQRVVEAGPDRVFAPVPYVRSLALLAALEEKQGRAGEARRLYERYLGYWKNGQLDREEVLRAGQRVAALRPLPSA